MIEVAISINAPLPLVWEKYTAVDDIQYWGFASEDWAAEGIENDVRPGGVFKNRNFAKDDSIEFIFGGIYDEVEPQQKLAYTLDDGRKVTVNFDKTDVDNVKILQCFDPESENSEEMQKAGWQAYLDNFKKYVESSN